MLKNYFVEMFVGLKFSHINNKYCYGIYYKTTFVQLCRHDAIVKLYRLLINLLGLDYSMTKKNSEQFNNKIIYRDFFPA